MKRLRYENGEVDAIDEKLLHALVAMDMPGPGTVFMNQNWNFPKPVYIGDSIRAEATVKSVRASRAIAVLEFTVTNQDGEEVLKGEAMVYQAQPRRVDL